MQRGETTRSGDRFIGSTEQVGGKNINGIEDVLIHWVLSVPQPDLANVLQARTLLAVYDQPTSRCENQNRVVSLVRSRSEDPAHLKFSKCDCSKVIVNTR